MNQYSEKSRSLERYRAFRGCVWTTFFSQERKNARARAFESHNNLDKNRTMVRTRIALSLMWAYARSFIRTNLDHALRIISDSRVIFRPLIAQYGCTREREAIRGGSIF